MAKMMQQLQGQHGNPYKGYFYEPKAHEDRQEHYTDDDLRDLMDSFGRNREGKTAIKEMRMCCNLLGLNPRESELREDLSILTNERNDGIVNTEDFVLLMRPKLGPDELSKEDLQAAFVLADKDNTGALSKAAVREILSDTPLSAEQVEELIIAADTDGDGTIDFDEFMAFFTMMTKS